jgi:hypothetical protein
MVADVSGGSWQARVETGIRGLRDCGIEAVNLQMEGDDIRELHVLSTSRRPPKSISRDIQTLLLTRFNRPIDYRVISVAYADPVAERPAPVSAPAPAPPPAVTPKRDPAADRVRFEGVNVYVSGARAHAQVELKWKGLPRMGSASGWSTRESAHRLIASATLAAVQEFLEEPVALSIEDTRIERMGRDEIVIVSLALIIHRERKTLVGCCTAGDDAQQAVVLATLSALNRLVSGLRIKEPTEYVLRPTSTLEVQRSET